MENNIEMPNHSENEITEELYSNKNEKKSKKKKILIFGTVVFSIILGTVILYIPSYQRSKEIKKNLDLGEKYLSENMYEEAKLSFDKVIEIDKKEVQGYEGKAEIAITTKDYEEAEKILIEAKKIKDTNSNQVMLATVYLNTERGEKALELMNSIKGTVDLNVKNTIRTGKILENQERFEEAERLYREKIEVANSKDEKEYLYDELIRLAFLLGKTRSEIEALSEEAQKSTENYNYVIENSIDEDIEITNDYLNRMFCYFASGFPEDFSTIDQLDKTWIIKRFFIEVGNEMRVYRNNMNFASLKDIEKKAQKELNSQVRLPEKADYYTGKVPKWLPEEKGFEWGSKGYHMLEQQVFLTKEGYVSGDRIYMIGSELVETRPNENPKSGDICSVSCNGQKIGSYVYKGTNIAPEYNFEVEPMEWLYIVEVDENSEPKIVSKERRIGK